MISIWKKSEIERKNLINCNKKSTSMIGHIITMKNAILIDWIQPHSHIKVIKGKKSDWKIN